MRFRFTKLASFPMNNQTTNPAFGMGAQNYY